MSKTILTTGGAGFIGSEKVTDYEMKPLISKLLNQCGGI